MITWAATVRISTRLYFVEYRHYFDSIRLFSYSLFILRLQFSTKGLALNVPRTEKDIIHLMIKYVHAVKEKLRQFSRPLRGIGAVHFAFR